MSGWYSEVDSLLVLALVGVLEDISTALTNPKSGQTTVVAPTYLAETAPKALRGLCVCAFSGCVYVGIML